jgi:hypothetical protein
MPEQDSSVDLQKLRQQVFDYVELRLGKGMIGVELDPEHLQNALTRAVEVFQTRSSAASEESFAFLTVQTDVQTYTLPKEIQYVMKIWRRSIGDLGAAGSQFDPFYGGWLNTYLLNTLDSAGGLLSFELFSNYQFQVSKMFGGEIDFNYNSMTKKLTLVRQPRGTGEHLLLQIYNLKPEVQLLSDPRSLTFLKEYTLAGAKMALGEARAKYGTVPGPAGGTSLNGAELKNEGQAMIDKLMEEIALYHFGETPLGMLIG